MKDATIEIIAQVNKHPNADRLDVATVLGFNCVTQKGLYKGKEKIVYIRPDAVLPVAPWTDSYRQYSPVRVKAVKLREVWSEGIIVPFEIFPEEIQQQLNKLKVGTDVGELLQVFHYDSPQNENEDAKGGMPYGIPKTDEERVENMNVERIPYGSNVDISLKIDGQSASFFYNLDDKRFGILARKEERRPSLKDKILTFLLLKFPTLNKFIRIKNNYYFISEKYQIKKKLIEYCTKYGVSLVIRGETYGDGLQAHEHNPHSKIQSQGPNFPEAISKNGRNWAMYSVYLMRERRYAEKGDAHYYVNVSKEIDLPICPMIEENVLLTQEKVLLYGSQLKKLNNFEFEGVVVKHHKTSFKIINKSYDSSK